MNARLLRQPEIDSCIRSEAETSADFGVCSVADLYIVLERIRKDNAACQARTALSKEVTTFQRLCSRGRIMVTLLSGSTLLDQAFVDHHTERLRLDPAVFAKMAPEESVHALSLKELAMWGWNPL